MEKRGKMRNEENYGVSEQFEEDASTNEKPGSGQQEADEAAPDAFQEATRVRPDNDVRERSQHDPSVPDGRHKEKGNGGKDRDKPYRSMDRSRSK